MYRTLELVQYSKLEAPSYIWSALIQKSSSARLCRMGGSRARPAGVARRRRPRRSWRLQSSRVASARTPSQSRGAGLLRRLPSMSTSSAGVSTRRVSTLLRSPRHSGNTTCLAIARRTGTPSAASRPTRGQSHPFTAQSPTNCQPIRPPIAVQLPPNFHPQLPQNDRPVATHIDRPQLPPHHTPSHPTDTVSLSLCIRPHATPHCFGG